MPIDIIIPIIPTAHTSAASHSVVFLFVFLLFCFFYSMQNKTLKLNDTVEFVEDVGGCIPENDSALNSFLDLVPTFG